MRRNDFGDDAVDNEYNDYYEDDDDGDDDDND